MLVMEVATAAAICFAPPFFYCNLDTYENSGILYHARAL